MAQGDQRRSHAPRVLGETITHYRERRGLYYRARPAYGLHRTFVGRLERGLYDPSLLHLLRIAQGLQVPFTALVLPLNWLPPEDLA